MPWVGVAPWVGCTSVISRHTLPNPFRSLPPAPPPPVIQGGDPTGTGKGGKSIYSTPNGKFADEMVDSLKHHKRGIVSMANSGPNTNGVLHSCPLLGRGLLRKDVGCV